MSGPNQSSDNEASSTSNDVPANQVQSVGNQNIPSSTTAENAKTEETSNQAEAEANVMTPIEGVQGVPSTQVQSVGNDQAKEVSNQAKGAGKEAMIPVQGVADALPSTQKQSTNEEVKTEVATARNVEGAREESLANLVEGFVNGTSTPKADTNAAQEPSTSEGTSAKNRPSHEIESVKKEISFIPVENLGSEIYTAPMESSRNGTASNVAGNEYSSAGMSNRSSGSHIQVLVPRAVPGVEVIAVSKKECWICRATEEEEPTETWAQPCRCKGSTQWVHRECLRLWVDEKLKENRQGKVSCPQCKTAYLLQFPKPNILVKILEKVDKLIDKVSPTIAVVILAGSIYWCALTYGAVTMIQISDDSTKVLEQMDQSVMLTAVPAIPVGLITLEMYHWEDSLLAFLRRISPHLPLFKHILPAPVTNESGSITDNLITDGMNCTRVFTSGLLLPTIATIVGNIFFPKMNSGAERAVVAGLTFIAVKGILKMYHKQQIYKRKSKRKILDYTQENIDRANAAAASNQHGPSAALNIESYRLPPSNN